MESPRNSANLRAVSFTKDGSFRLPRCGTGAKYGESVSINMRSSGTSSAASRICCALGKVRLPAKEIIKPMSSARFAWSQFPVKQCRIPPSPFGARSEEHTSELQSLRHLVFRLLLEKTQTLFSRRSFPVGLLLFQSSDEHTPEL